MEEGASWRLRPHVYLHHLSYGCDRRHFQSCNIDVGLTAHCLVFFFQRLDNYCSMENEILTDFLYSP